MTAFARSPRYRWVILAAAAASVFGALGLARFSYTSILPAMQAGLKLSNTQAGGLATANLGGYLAMALVGGTLSLGDGTLSSAGGIVWGGRSRRSHRRSAYRPMMRNSRTETGPTRRVIFGSVPAH